MVIFCKASDHVTLKAAAEEKECTATAQSARGALAG